MNTQLNSSYLISRNLKSKNLTNVNEPLDDSERSKKWMNAIESHLREVKSKRNLSVCETHFAPEDVNKDYRTTLSNGDVHIIPRKIPILKSSAIPCVFQNEEIDINNTGNAMQIDQTEIQANPNVQPIYQNSEIHGNLTKTEGTDENLSVTNNTIYTFHNLRQDIIESNLRYGWAVSLIHEGILFVHIISDRIPIIAFVDNSMNVTVRALDISITKKLSDVTCFEDFCNYLNSLAQLTPCVGIEDILARRHEHCEKLIQSLCTGMNLTKRCENCKRSRKNEKENERKKLQRAERKKVQQKRNRVLHIIKQKCSRLEIKYAKLRMEMDQIIEKNDSLNK
ncbi:hypothetical protein NQ317_015948 [Molorchus minor]|uniref:THAP-type domain-containing protein n=1 Tax=Molorchus minor TaxID=1323400 RepID=A0ABQ9JKJ3_9CUCU|nr:hypothetical protein NQ317_015948 [Molorchus minor]